MNFEEALQKIKENSHLIGSKIAMGTIDELVIYPNNEEAKIIFMDIYFKIYEIFAEIFFCDASNL